MRQRQPNLKITVRSRFVDKYLTRLNDTVKKAAGMFDLVADQVHVTLVDRPTMSRLNRDYRKMNGPTDVLTFTMDEPGWKGDIVICLPYAKEQAKKRHVALQHELDRLVVHGLAHLAGFEHDTINHFSQMRAAELAVLQKVIR